MSDNETRPVWISRGRAEDAGLEFVWDDSPADNRWAAFTDDELDTLDSCTADYTDSTDIWPLAAERLFKEIQAEIERRTA